MWVAHGQTPQSVRATSHCHDEEARGWADASPPGLAEDPPTQHEQQQGPNSGHDIPIAHVRRMGPQDIPIPQQVEGNEEIYHVIVGTEQQPEGANLIIASTPTFAKLQPLNKECLDLVVDRTPA
eukprot:8151527-Alexandrium_andersonii.AAC.1